MLVAKCLILNIIPIILGSICAEDYQQNIVYQAFTDQLSHGCEF